jgi:hypothetical protein
MRDEEERGDPIETVLGVILTMKGGLSTAIIFSAMLLLSGCGQEEGQEDPPKEAQLQKSLDRINELLEKSERGEGPVFQDVERLRAIKANLEKELGAERAAKYKK